MENGDVSMPRPTRTRLLVIQENTVRATGKRSKEGAQIVAPGCGNQQVAMGRVVAQGPEVDAAAYPLGCWVHYDRGAARPITGARQVYYAVDQAAVWAVEAGEAVEVVSDVESWQAEHRAVAN